MANNDDKRGLASASDDTKQRVAKAGGDARADDQDVTSGELGRKGGKAAQASGNAHQLTDEERSRGGSNSGGNFANDPERAREAAKQRNDQ